jgi:acyl carrier protein
MEQVRDLMLNVFDIDDLTLADATTAHDVEEWDSLHHIRLMVAIERHFKVRFSNVEVETLQNVGELIDLIDRKLNG